MVLTGKDNAASAAVVDQLIAFEVMLSDELDFQHPVEVTESAKAAA